VAAVAVFRPHCLAEFSVLDVAYDELSQKCGGGSVGPCTAWRGEDAAAAMVAGEGLAEGDDRGEGDGLTLSMAPRVRCSLSSAGRACGDQVHVVLGDIADVLLLVGEGRKNNGETSELVGTLTPNFCLS